MASIHFPMTPRRGSGVYNCGFPKRAFSLDSVVVYRVFILLRFLFVNDAIFLLRLASLSLLTVSVKRSRLLCKL